MKTSTARNPWLFPPDTLFSEAVREAVKDVPLGRVVRYKDVAERLRHPRTAAPAVSRSTSGAMAPPTEEATESKR